LARIQSATSSSRRSARRPAPARCRAKCSRSTSFSPFASHQAPFSCASTRVRYRSGHVVVWQPPQVIALKVVKRDPPARASPSRRMAPVPDLPADSHLAIRAVHRCASRAEDGALGGSVVERRRAARARHRRRARQRTPSGLHHTAVRWSRASRCPASSASAMRVHDMPSRGGAPQRQRAADRRTRSDLVCWPRASHRLNGPRSQQFERLVVGQEADVVRRRRAPGDAVA
jgi:hypothetical protein